MNRSIRAALTAGILVAPLMAVLAYSRQAATPQFEVASIKPYKDSGAGGPIMVGGGCRGIDSPAPGTPGGPGGQTTIVAIAGGPGGPPPAGSSAAGGNLSGRLAGPPSTPIGRCVFTRMTLKMLMNAAYRLTALGGSLDQLLTGGPSWISTDPFDVEAKAEDPAHTSQDELRVMLQNLLTERFKLKFHREQKETQGFDLVIAKGGLKMKPADDSLKGPGSMALSFGNPSNPGMASVTSQNSTMTAIVGFLSGRLGRAIRDKTGLTGKYDFSLTWAPGENEAAAGPLGFALQPPPQAPGVAASEPGISIFTALQEQMGLRLESAKVMIDALVIDSAEKPQEQ